MRIKLLAVGKMGKGAIADLVADYLKRFNWTCEIVELIPKKLPTALKQKQHEADLILQSVSKGYKLVVLDERGQNISSPELALKLQDLQNQGHSALCIVIGGADGLDASVRDQADLVLSFGRTTWPHMLMRVLVLEQLYRAQQILSGHPYHRE